MYWRLTSRVRRQVGENPSRGASRIHGKLRMLGFELSERTISRWMKRSPRDPDRAKSWLAFLRNYREAIAAMVSSPCQRLPLAPAVHRVHAPAFGYRMLNRRWVATYSKIQSVIIIRLQPSSSAICYSSCLQCPQRLRLKTLPKYHKMGMIPGSSMVEHSAVNRELQIT